MPDQRRPWAPEGLDVPVNAQLPKPMDRRIVAAFQPFADRALAVIDAHKVWIFSAYAAAFLAFSAYFRNTVDYPAYLQQWRVVVQGGDPWATQISLGLNAYGPLHNIYGLLFLAHPKLPRLFGSMLWLAAMWPIVNRIIRAQFSSSRRLFLLAAMLFNPFPWGWVAAFGANDTFVAVFLAFALLALSRGASVAAGVFVALGGLMKFYPVLLIPFLAFDRRRLDAPFLATSLGVFAAGMGAAFAMWGPSIWIPLASAAGRETSLMSIYEFLEASPLSPLRGVAVPTLITQAVFGSILLVVFLIYFQRRGRRIGGMVLGLLSILLGYRLGHFQFYLPLILLIPLTIVVANPERRVATSLLAVLVLASFFPACYEVLGALHRPSWIAVVRENCGLAAAIAEGVAVVAILRSQASAASRLDLAARNAV
jgi:hypothetical protein